MARRIRYFTDDTFIKHEKAEQAINGKRQSLAEHHQHQRDQLKQAHANRWVHEAKARSALLPTGLKALWFRVTGKYRQIKKLNEVETQQCRSRDQSERQKLIDRQLRERRKIQHDIRLLRHQRGIQIKKLNRDMGEYLKLPPEDREKTFKTKRKKEIIKSLPRHQY